MYRTYNARPIPQPYKPQRSHSWLRALLVLLVLVNIYGAYALLRPVGDLKTTILPPVIPAEVKVNIPWPTSGQAAFGADDYGLLASHTKDGDEQKSSPMASVAKAITALSILEKKPLKPGEPGPLITMTARDVELYNQYIAKDGAAVPVFEGEKITQYQALQAMMLPSANNIADTTAIWAFGSLENYTVYANNLVKKLGMAHTVVTDASGFSPSTISTASDLIKLGDAALDNPVLAEIVAQKQAVFPEYGTIENVNSLLGTSGIRGIKTGNTEEAGGCYLAAADIVVGGKKITVITAIMGSTSRSQAMKDSVPIIQSAVSQFQQVHVVRAGQSAGSVTSAWGGHSDLVAGKDITVLSWTGTAISPEVRAKNLQVPAKPHANAGVLTLGHNGESLDSPLYTKQAISAPTLWWRLAHPL